MDSTNVIPPVTSPSKGRILFEEYYQQQHIVPADEWDAFLLCLKEPLPITFRVVQTTQHAAYILRSIENFAQEAKQQNVKFQRLQWYPHNCAFEISISRYDLRSNPLLKQFHAFLVQESNAGLIYRQEAVSMVPPLFIDVKEDSWILDMCASPGSKTSQLLEEMHKIGSGDSAHLSAVALPPRGVVVANDANSRRGHMLIHNLRHLHSVSLVVTNHAAQRFPFSYNQETKEFVKYDAVLCDVPCTADGTLRKAPSILDKWHYHQSLGMHRLQVQILRRGVELCKVGGTIVYSTCSLNPIEDEAVVAAIVEFAGGAIEVVNTRNKIAHLRHTNGLTTWKVKFNGEWYTDYEALPTDAKTSRKVQASMFPVKDKAYLSQLVFCQRYLPHHNNTGGFFVAVLRKRWELSRGNVDILHEALEGAQEPMVPMDVGLSSSVNEDRNGLFGADVEAVSLLDSTAEGLQEATEGTDLITESKQRKRWMCQQDYYAFSRFVSHAYTGIQLWSELSEMYGLHSVRGEEVNRDFFQRVYYKPDHRENECVEGFMKRHRRKDTLGRRVVLCTEVVDSSQGLVSSNGNELLSSKEMLAYASPVGALKEAMGTASDTHVAKSDAPRKLWYVGEGVYRLLQCVGRSPYAILSAGCLFAQHTSLSQYRIQDGASSSLLAYFYPLKGAAVVTIQIQTLLLLLTMQPYPTPTVDTTIEATPADYKIPLEQVLTVEAQNARDVGHQETSCGRLKALPIHSPLLLSVARDPEPILVPCWKGLKNMELLISETRRYVLRWLLEDLEKSEAVSH